MRKALLVGINEYQSISPLYGCVNDVIDMHRTIREVLGFRRRDITVLTDREASYVRILKELYNLVRGPEENDYLLFYFAGHGSQIYDDGNDERDGLDELLCPYNMDWYANTFLRDDTLHGIFRPCNATIEVIIDACHSGTVLRDEVKGVHNRSVAPPPSVWLRYDGLEKKFRKRFIDSGAVEIKHHILWAGCRDDENCADLPINGVPRGLFTYSWCKVLRENPGLSRKHLIRHVRDRVHLINAHQTPQLTCNADFR